jgi:hypothetical protein
MAVVRFVGLSVAGVLYGVIFAFILGGLFYFLAESAGYLWLPLALPVYGLLLLLLLLALLVIPSLTRNMVRRASMPGRRSDLFFAISVVIGYPLVFIFISGQFLRYWSLQFGGFSPRGGD